MAKIKELSDIIMRKQSPQTISEVQKIWHRVMSILYRSGGCSVKIPSSNELAREFGVARSTVRIALEKLTEEGFLVTRRGQRDLHESAGSG